MIETDVYSTLTTGSPTAAGTRVYPMMMPQNPTLPAITYQRVASAPVVSLSGNNGKDLVRIQVSCWASSYSVAKALAVQVRTAMAALSGTLQLEIDDYEPDVKIYRVLMDFSLWQTT